MTTIPQKLIALAKIKFDGSFTVKDGCWLWHASNGWYGSFYYKGYKLKAHRASYLIYVGPIPKNIFVLHKCDVKRCVNPSHLFLGTQKENVRDWIEKNHPSFPRPKGEDHYRCKLTEKIVKKIRMESSMGKTSRELAQKYGVSRTNISAIIIRRSWTHI